MTFFDDEKPKQQKTTRVDPFDADCARQLAQALFTRGLIKGAVNIPKWSEYFARLRTSGTILVEAEYTDAKPTIKKVLTWYCKNIKEPFVPECLSAAAFYRKFVGVRNAMRRAGVKDQVITVSKEAQQLAERLSTRYWPSTTLSQLPEAVEISLQNYRAFYRRVREIGVDPKEDPALLRFINHLLDTYKLGPGGELIYEWFIEVSQWLQKRRTWSGSLHDLAFSVDCERLQTIGHDWAIGYCIDYTRWDLLIERVKDGS